jgi:hypothetical protein
VKLPVKSILAAGIAAALLGMLAANGAAAAKIYKCEDAKKKVTISDRPCNENAPAAAAADKAAAADADKKDGKQPPPKKDEKKDAKKG